MTFQQCIDEMYITDKKLCAVAISSNENLDDDFLDKHYSLNKKLNMQNEVNKIVLFNILQRQATPSRNEIVCQSMNISFNLPKVYGWISKETINYMVSEIIDLSQKNHQPFSLQHISAASSIPTLKKCAPQTLLCVYQIAKNLDISIRAGALHTRKCYEYSAIVKNYMYKSINKSLVNEKYFNNFEKNRPVPYCNNCGLQKKLEENECLCNICNIMRNALMFTSIVEKWCHTIYF